MGAGDPVWQVQVVGQHALIEQLERERLLSFPVIVDPAQQHGLVQQRHSGGLQRFEGGSRVRVQLLGMVDVHHHDDRLGMRFERVEQSLGHTLRDDDGQSGVNSQPLQVGDAGQLGQQLNEVRIVERERVAARQNELFDVLILPEHRKRIPVVSHLVLLIGELTPEAVSAVHRAGGCGDEERARCVLLQQTGRAYGPRLLQRIRAILGVRAMLRKLREHLEQQRIGWIPRTHARQKWLRHPQREGRRVIDAQGRQVEPLKQLGGPTNGGAQQAFVVVRLPRGTVRGYHARRLQHRTISMASYSTNEFKSGLKVLLEGEPCSILENEFVKPGKGQAFNRVKFRNLKSGRVWERTFKSGESIEGADVMELDMEFLYTDGEFFHFMKTDGSFEQIAATEAVVGEARDWMKEQEVFQVTLWNDDPIAVTPPNFVELEVTETDPGLKGDTAQGATKPATVSTGATVKVPLFVNQGDVLKIDTRTGEYINRVK